MKEFSKWISDHNPEGSGRYRMSLIGVVCYFVLLALYLCNCGWEDGWLWILLAAVISWDVGRYCLNRFLYVRGEEMFDDRQAVSRVLRFHAFDVDGYFRELRARLFAPILVILVCAALCAGTVWFDGRSRISGVIFVSLTGLAGMAMVCVAYLTKKWQVSREMQGQADRVMGTLLQICDKLFYVIEFLGITVGFVVTVIFSWIVMKAVIQPEPGSSSSLACLSFFAAKAVTQPTPGEADIVYRSYAKSYDLYFGMLGVAALAAGIVRTGRTRFRKVCFILCAACLTAGMVMICLQNGNYTEVAGESFRVCVSGQEKEYDIKEAKNFCIHWSDQIEGIQLTLTFRDGETYGVFGSEDGYNSCYEKKYPSEFDFVRDYAGRMLREGIEGTLEDRQELEEYAQDQGQNRKQAWREICTLPFS